MPYVAIQADTQELFQLQVNELQPTHWMKSSGAVYDAYAPDKLIWWAVMETGMPSVEIRTDDMLSTDTFSSYPGTLVESKTGVPVGTRVNKKTGMPI